MNEIEIQDWILKALVVVVRLLGVVPVTEPKCLLTTRLQKYTNRAR